MKLRLKKDLVIPAGTIFDDAPTNIVQSGGVETIIGLSKDSSGRVTYFPQDMDDAFDEWFEDVDNAKKGGA